PYDRGPFPDEEATAGWPPSGATLLPDHIAAPSALLTRARLRPIPGRAKAPPANLTPNGALLPGLLVLGPAPDARNVVSALDRRGHRARHQPIPGVGKRPSTPGPACHEFPAPAGCV